MLKKTWATSYTCEDQKGFQQSKITSSLASFSKGRGMNMNRVKFRRTCMESSEYNWANISETICPETRPENQANDFEKV